MLVEEVKELREKNFTYEKIADMLNISFSTVGRICRKYNLSKKCIVTCRYCGNVFVQNSGWRKKEFCNESCRKKWWNKRGKTEYICETCGKLFRDYESRKRKFCSRECFLRRRKK